jgi:hypothetical protein
MNKQSKYTEWLQWIMVILVLLSAIYTALKEGKTDIIFNLCTLTFGYYFGSTQSNIPPDRQA